ncbi:uncharacterized protein A4U43_C10F550 [Asparagus officinalis]|uniref:Methyltransferase type 11 domain-containing protein n=1 Tax=Asparagus officinalis TaxID=4686 RepID=A0A5P1DZL0_ASPOF|nr:uncharacterized protein A4U43_C10F550 [Asparagus officinalis]
MDAALRLSGHCPFLSMHDAAYGSVRYDDEEGVREKDEGLKKGIAEVYDESFPGCGGGLLGDHCIMLYEPRSGGGLRQGLKGSPGKRRFEWSTKPWVLPRPQVSFQVADALNQPFPDGEFDLVWSMESGEHMPDKIKFVSELARVAAPGATIIIVTWCHRDLSPEEDSLKPEEKNLLNKICSAYYLPEWCSAADYVKIAQSLKLQDIKTADWSENVAPFWPAVIQSAFTWQGFTSLIRSGWKTIRGALVMPLMIEGYKKNLIKFAIITCRKPE